MQQLAELATPASPMAHGCPGLPRAGVVSNYHNAGFMTDARQCGLPMLASTLAKYDSPVGETSTECSALLANEQAANFACPRPRQGNANNAHLALKQC